MTRILFIGLGNMGLPMALNLLKAGHTVRGFDLSKDALQKFAAAGGELAGELTRDVRESEFVLTMLPSGPIAEDVLLGKTNLLAAAPKGTTFVDMSTIDRATSLRLHDEAQKAGHKLLDAPVSGGTAGAAAGTLSFMVGGDADTLERVRPLLSVMGKNIFLAGGPGAGQAAKACNNVLLAIHMIGTAEALNLGASLGLDPKVLTEIMSKSSGSNWSLNTYNPYPGVQENSPASRGYSGGFAVNLMCKDLGLALTAALEGRIALPMGHAAYDLYRMHAQSGAGALDFSSIIQPLAPEGSPAKG